MLHPLPTRPARARTRRAPEAVAALVERAAGGDELAWGALVDEFGDLVRAVARAHRLGDADVADVAQTTWLRLFEHLGRLHEPARVGAWLATTARRESLRVLRRRAQQVPTAEPPERADDRPGQDAWVVAAERDAVLRTALGRLAARDQQLLRLLVAEPAPSYAEISERLDMPIGSIGPTRGRCLQRLAREAERLGLTAEAA
jgi:RNA polymerase sigma factor (sigma-70 family)